jgi:hypothetical protein
MNWFLWTLGGVLLGTAGWIAYTRADEGRARRRGQPPVEELAHQLQEAWSDYHTAV